MRGSFTRSFSGRKQMEPGLRRDVVLSELGGPGRAWDPRHGRTVKLLLVAGTLVLMASVALSSTWGAVNIPAAHILQMALRRVPLVAGWLDTAPRWPAAYEAVVLDIRLPRLVLASLVGASLSVAGATYQGLFRNPLADPYLLGVASGAGLGAVAALVLPLPGLFYQLGAVQWMAFAGALLTVGAVYLLARAGRTTPMTTLLLAGVALGAFATSITSFLMYMNQDKLQMVYSWLLGGFSLGSWHQVLLILPYIVLGFGVICVHARLMNVLQLDEEQASQLGVNVERLKLVLVSAATLITAAAVSVSGLIGFVGLIVPHAVRLLWGGDHRLLLPVSAVAGGVFMLWADTLARMVLAPVELPVGVITAFCGAPFFLYLLRQRKRMVF